MSTQRIAPLKIRYCDRCLTQFAVDNAGEAAVWTDQDGQLLYANQAAGAMLGYSADELLFLDLAKVAPALAERVARAGPGDVPFTMELEVRPQAGKSVPVEASVSRVVLEDRSFHCVFLRDISERKRLEEHLREAQKLEALGRVVAGLAHDFNNILTAVLIYSGMLANDLDPESAHAKHAEEIKAAGERGAELVAQLLAISRQQVLQPRMMSLNEIVQGRRDMLQRLIGEEVRLEVQCASDLAEVELDPIQMERVLLNLSLNARDAMPRGGRLAITTENVAVDGALVRQHPGLTPGGYVRVTVRDSGCGMDAATRDRAFEPFFTTKEPGKGTGLGLALVHGIVRQSGGQVYLSSEPGQGTTVSIHLPRSTAAAEAAAPKPAARAAKVIPIKAAKTILLVEDEDLVRRPVCEGLERAGYHVLQARNPRDAVQVAEKYKGPIQLLVTDVVMPGMSGYELADQLLSTRARMRVLYMSGRAEDAGQPSRQPFMPKPFSPLMLARTVQEILEPTSLRGEGKKW